MKLNITEETIKRRTSKHVAVQAIERGEGGEEKNKIIEFFSI